MAPLKCERALVWVPIPLGSNRRSPEGGRLATTAVLLPYRSSVLYLSRFVLAFLTA